MNKRWALLSLGSPTIASAAAALASAVADLVDARHRQPCSRQATWLAVTHKPCGGPKLLCAEHVLRWMGEAMEIIVERGEMHCPDCDEWLLTPEQCIRFRPL